MRKSSYNSWAPRLAALAASFIFAAMPIGLSAQGMSGLIQESLQRKYDILKQNADTDRIRAEAERKLAETRASQAANQTGAASSAAPAASGRYAVPADAGLMNGVPTYRLANGDIIQSTGGFYSEGMVCIANCP